MPIIPLEDSSLLSSRGARGFCNKNAHRLLGRDPDGGDAMQGSKKITRNNVHKIARWQEACLEYGCMHVTLESQYQTHQY